jgi:hypothetical protein
MTNLVYLLSISPRILFLSKFPDIRSLCCYFSLHLFFFWLCLFVCLFCFQYWGLNSGLLAFRTGTLPLEPLVYILMIRILLKNHYHTLLIMSRQAVFKFHLLSHKSFPKFFGVRIQAIKLRLA